MPAPTGATSWADVARRLDAWMADRDYAGYEPFDYLTSPLIEPLTFGNRYARIAWTQLGKRLPLQLRPLLAIRPARNPKAIGLVLGAHVRLAPLGDEHAHRKRAAELIDWLAANVAEGYSGAGWGYPFPWANRDFYAPAGTPASVPTAFIAHALLDANERLGMEQARRLAQHAGDFLRAHLNRIPGPEGTFCFSYTPLDRRAVHNASLLTASVLARLTSGGGDSTFAEDALAAARFTMLHQRTDGSWPYGVGPRNAWVDSFHTSYNLVALQQIQDALGTAEFEEVLERGTDYWARTFLRGDGIAFHAGRRYPIDMHAVAHTILTLVELRGRVSSALDRAERLADWALTEMRHPEGWFYHQRGRFYTNRLPYMRWVQAWMLRALAGLAEARSE